MQQNQDESEQSWRHEYVIAVVGPKGGVGKTFVATNLAVGLAQGNPASEIALIDYHPRMGDVSTFLNIEAKTSLPELDEIVTAHKGSRQELINLTFFNYRSGVKVLSGKPNLKRPELDVKTAFVPLRGLYRYFDYFIQDIATDINQEVLSGPILSDASLILVVSRPTLPALKNTRIVLDLIDDGRLSDRTLVILNQVDEDIRVSDTVLSQYLRQYSVAVSIPSDAAVVRSVNEGKPLLDVEPDRLTHPSPATAALQDLIRHVKRRLPPDKIQKLQAKFKPPQDTPESYVRKKVRTPEEEVYAELLEHMQEGRENRYRYVVIADETEPIDLRYYFPQHVPLTKIIPQLQLETVSSFVLANEEPQPLSSGFDPRLPFVLLSKEDWEEIDGYFGLHMLYPEALSIIHFSGIGFNQQQDQALVFWSEYSELLSGIGGLELLTRESGFWEIQETLLRSVS